MWVAGQVLEKFGAMEETWCGRHEVSDHDMGVEVSVEDAAKKSVVRF